MNNFYGGFNVGLFAGGVLSLLGPAPTIVLVVYGVVLLYVYGHLLTYPEKKFK